MTEGGDHVAAAGGDSASETSSGTGSNLPSADSTPVPTGVPGSVPDIMAMSPEQALVHLNKLITSLLALHGCVVDESAIEDDEDEHANGNSENGHSDGHAENHPDEHQHKHTRRWSSNDVGDSSIDDIGSPRRSHERSKKASFFLAEAHEVAMLVDGGEGETITISEVAQMQIMAIAKRFWSKTKPDISVSKYLQRLHKYCPSSTAVYLTAGVYIYRLCIGRQTVPLTELSVHRLVLAAVRVASKSLEDMTHPQSRYATVGGISAHDLFRLEVALLFLVDFQLKVDHDVLSEALSLWTDVSVQSVRLVEHHQSRKRTRSS